MSFPRSLLIVDDDAAMRQVTLSMVKGLDVEAVAVSSGEEALEQIREREFTAVLTDVKMPGISGLELLREVRQLRPNVPVILMTAFGSISAAVEATQEGAFQYLAKPFRREEALLIIERALEHYDLEEENRRLRRAVDQTKSCGDLLGESAAMREIFSHIRKIANTASTVLITGESGTGKEVVARALHFSGSRANKPFVPINCSAIPEGLLESELFGHVRGAFTGAHATKRGLFEEAGEGTLFLDEIGEISLSLQAKLLRVLEDRKVRPVGGNREVAVHARIVAATNRNIRRGVEAGNFRKDLFFRLNVIPIAIPPLRERPEDVRVLAEHFVRKHATDPRQRLSLAVLAKLERAPWEGNVRELENAIERAIAFSDHLEIGPDDFPFLDQEELSDAEVGQGRVRLAGDFLDHAVERRMKLQELEDRYIAEILKLTDGNKVQAAEILGINRRTLYRRYDEVNRFLDESSKGSPQSPDVKTD